MPSQALATKPLTELDRLLVDRDMLTGEIASLEEASRNEQNDLLLGYDEAEQRVSDLSQKIGELTLKRNALQSRINTLNNEAALSRPARDAEAKFDRNRLLAQLARKRFDLATEIQTRMDEAGNLLREFEMNARELAHAAGHQEAHRLFGPGAFLVRIQQAFYRTFEMLHDPHRTSGAPAPRYFPYQLPFNGQHHFTKTLPELEVEALDHLPLNIFPTREHAEAACKRRDPSGHLLHVKAEHDYFVIVAGELRGAAAKDGRRP